MSEWFFTSDLHGQTDLYEQIVAAVSERRPRAVLLGGDLCPHATGVEGVRRQRLFLEGLLVEFARRLHEAAPGIELLLLMGNDDWRANEHVLERREGELWRMLHERVCVVDGIPVAGASWVPITPFTLKDWERWEDGEAESPSRLDGWVSDGDGVRAHAFDPEQRRPTISESLERLAAAAPAGEAVFVTHSPPRDTTCDVIGSRQHVGSRAIRGFLERHQPPLALSGHIHESPRVTGAYRDAIGRTLVVNPGQFGAPRLCGVWFDPRRAHETMRHTVYDE